MKRSKRIYLLLGILVVASIATFAVTRLEEHKEKIKNSDQVILEVPRDEVQSIAWEYQSKSFAFHKEDKWVYDEDGNFPVDEEKINELLDQFQKFGAAFIIEEVEDFGQYGLDHPICTIKLTTGARTYEIQLGNYSSMDSQRYVSIGDGNVYLVKDDPMNKFNVELKNLIDHDEIPTMKEVKEIKFSGAEGYTIVHEEESNHRYRKEDVYTAKRNGNDLPLDASRVNQYLKYIRLLNLNNYVTYHATQEDLKQYGLDTPELTVTVNYTTEKEKGEAVSESFVLNISRDPEEKKAAEEADQEGKENAAPEKVTAYVRVGASPIIYQITADEYNKLGDASYNAFRHQEILPVDFAEIQQMEITLEGTRHTITTEKEADKRKYYYQGEEIDIVDFQNALNALKAESFTEEQPTQKKEISLKVALENENYPAMQIDLYRYDGTYCLAMVDGKPVSLIKRAQVVDFIEAVNGIVLK